MSEDYKRKNKNEKYGANMNLKKSAFSENLIFCIFILYSSGSYHLPLMLMEILKAQTKNEHL